MSEDLVVVAILVKDKAHCLPFYLSLLEAQSYPKEKMALWIRSNNNNDNSIEIIEDWLKKVSINYHSVFKDYSDVIQPVQKYGQHEWPEERLKVLGKIRQESIDYAIGLGAHYFVADADNFIKKGVVETLLKTGLPAVAPLLRNELHGRLYANYHFKIDPNGYYQDHPLYCSVLFHEIKGLIEVPVIHCTYFLRNEILPFVKYEDSTSRYEYVIFSDSLRKSNIKQYIDNRNDYGVLSFAENKEDLLSEPWWSSKEERFLISSSVFFPRVTIARKRNCSPLPCC